MELQFYCLASGFTFQIVFYCCFLFGIDQFTPPSKIELFHPGVLALNVLQELTSGLFTPQ